MKRVSNYPPLLSLCFLFTLLLSSCGSEGGTESTTDAAPSTDEFRSYAIDIDKSMVRFADVFESVELIQLEETAESLLGYAERVKLAGDQFVFPSNDNGDIYIFSDQGKFKSKFNNTGGAEGEYETINDLWMSGDTIVVYDSKKRTAYWYNQQGDYLKSLKMPEGTGHMFPLGNGYVTDMTFAPEVNSDSHMVWVLDNELQKENMMIPHVYRILFPMGQKTNSFSRYNGKLMFKAMYTDTTYFLDEEKVTPFIQVDFGEKYLWKDEKFNDNMVAAMMALPEGDGVWNYTPHVGPDLIYMTYDISLKKLAALIDRETGEYVILNTFMKNEERYDLAPLAWDGDRLLCSIPSSSISTLLGEMEEGQWQFANGATQESIEASENPVLMWVKFKDKIM